MILKAFDFSFDISFKKISDLYSSQKELLDANHCMYSLFQTNILWYL